MKLRLKDATIRKRTKAAIYVEVDTIQHMGHQPQPIRRKESIWLPLSVCEIEGHWVYVRVGHVNFVELKEREIAGYRKARLVEILVWLFSSRSLIGLKCNKWQRDSNG